MKYIAILFALVFGTVANASVDDSPFNGKYKMKPNVYTECHEGFLFIIAASPNGVAIMQVFKDAGDMVPKPVECSTQEKVNEE